MTKKQRHETITFALLFIFCTALAVGAFLPDGEQATFSASQRSATTASAAAGATQYEYDALGWLVKETKPNGEIITYTYDYDSNLTEVTDSNGTTKYVYGTDHERVMKINPDGTWVQYIGDMSEVNDKGEWTDYLIANGERIAAMDGSGIHYYINDHLGSPQLVINQNGQVEQKIDYLAYGVERINEINRMNSIPYMSPFGFTGQRKDTNTGLLYYGARYYNPTIGRFTQPDPALVEMRNRELIEAAMQHPQKLNPYAYVENNPVNRVDPSGEDSVIAINDRDNTITITADIYI